MMRGRDGSRRTQGGSAFSWSPRRAGVSAPSNLALVEAVRRRALEERQHGIALEQTVSLRPRQAPAQLLVEGSHEGAGRLAPPLERHGCQRRQQGEHHHRVPPQAEEHRVRRHRRQDHPHRRAAEHRPPRQGSPLEERRDGEGGVPESRRGGSPRRASPRARLPSWRPERASSGARGGRRQKRQPPLRGAQRSLAARGSIGFRVRYQGARRRVEGAGELPRREGQPGAGVLRIMRRASDEAGILLRLVETSRQASGPGTTSR